MVPTRRRLDPRELHRVRNINSAWWHWAVNVLSSSRAISRKHRKAILDWCGVDTGTAIIESGCFFFSDNLTLGPYAIINGDCYLDTREHISLGERTGLSPGCMLITST